MQWYEFLGYGTLGGLVCGGFFFALGSWLDRRQAEQWRREMNDAEQTAPLSVQIIRDDLDGA